MSDDRLKCEICRRQHCSCGEKKRGRGRPRKDPATIKPSCNSGGEKRGRGRPRKDPAAIQPGSSSGGIKRGRGRPRKDPAAIQPGSSSGGIKRGRGRPRKDPAASQPSCASGVAKRRRGRPPKNRAEDAENAGNQNNASEDDSDEHEIEANEVLEDGLEIAAADHPLLEQPETGDRVPERELLDEDVDEEIIVNRSPEISATSPAQLALQEDHTGDRAHRELAVAREPEFDEFMDYGNVDNNIDLDNPQGIEHPDHGAILREEEHEDVDQEIAANPAIPFLHLGYSDVSSTSYEPSARTERSTSPPDRYRGAEYRRRVRQDEQSSSGAAGPSGIVYRDRQTHRAREAARFTYPRLRQDELSSPEGSPDSRDSRTHRYRDRSRSANRSTSRHFRERSASRTNRRDRRDDPKSFETAPTKRSRMADSRRQVITLEDSDDDIQCLDGDYQRAILNSMATERNDSRMPRSNGNGQRQEAPQKERPPGRAELSAIDCLESTICNMLYLDTRQNKIFQTVRDREGLNELLEDSIFVKSPTVQEAFAKLMEKLEPLVNLEPIRFFEKRRIGCERDHKLPNGLLQLEEPGEVKCSSLVVPHGSAPFAKILERRFMETLSSGLCTCWEPLLNKRTITPYGRHHVMLIDGSKSSKILELTSESIVVMYGSRWSIISFVECLPHPQDNNKDGYFVSWTRNATGEGWTSKREWPVEKMEKPMIDFKDHNVKAIVFEK